MSIFSTKLALAVTALALIAAACGGDDEGGGSSIAPIDTTPAATTAPAPAGEPAAEGDPAPTQSFALFDGTQTSLQDFEGQPVVLNFWASWCPSCVAEMSSAFRPVEQDLGEQITFLGMNIQDDRQLANQLLEETGVDWVNAEDPNGELYVELGGLGMPFTVYIDTNGNVLHEHNGPLDERLLRNQISEHLGVAS